MTTQFDALCAGIRALSDRLDQFVTKSANDGASIANLTAQNVQLTSQVQSLTVERDALKVSIASAPATDDPAAIQAQADAVAALAAKIPG